MSSSQDQPGGGLERLEEAVMFLERQVEQLADSLTDISKRLAQLGSRVARIEARVEGLAAPKPDEDAAAGDSPEADND